MRSLFPLGIAAACAFAPAASADVIFSDTEFATANWGVDLINIGSAGSMTPAQVSGGNPGLCRQVDQSPGATVGDKQYALHRFGTTTSTRYDPATQGAILSLSFSIDYKEIAGAGATGHQLVYAAAKQGQTVFIGSSVDTHGSIFGFVQFTTGALIASDFTAVGGTGAPDLSSAGQPIRFGFVTAVTNVTGVLQTRTDYDNWSVHITQAPAPGSIAILGIAGLLSRRRR